jgi:hypothetical protein
MNELRVLVTGSRHWKDRAAIRSALAALSVYLVSPDSITIIHGGADGADTLADEEAENLGYKREPYPISKEEWRPPHLHGRIDYTAGPRRNQQMLDTGIDLVLAFPQGESRGTRGCMKLAEKMGIPVKNCAENHLT